ncbi:hypothetical protein G6O67_001807 [Ophiocordyceps sinensis]|uniref:Uncharacterized protein n=2 Tax=Ophiocordyceps sinensis TaxID=72228 RepID=A0A8H4V6L2_9HYPO|nr:hypothetical protein OCS_05967 [Ophiocordyceps sinensis CO18]KAF4509869.1 hypothetical protein G6O67_001807 [Ophiocordyceps sinensis]
MASRVTRRLLSTTARRLQAESQADLKRETKRNPELMILGGVMVVALGGAGFYLGRSPTGSTSEATVHIARDGMPWEGDAQGKYKYHPGGDPSREPRDAPSALNAVIVPNVTLPRELHDKYNKWGKDGYP